MEVSRVSGRVPADLPAGALPLLEQADAAAAAGDLERSAARLERAVQVAPKHPWLWHRLALVRLFQGRHGEAASLAARSSALAPGHPALQAANWRIVAQARAAQGRMDGAREAARRAEGLMR
jgi:predicted Zn-dependent protease